MPYHISQNRGGGAEVQAWFLAAELARRGYDVHYICQSVVPEKSGQTEHLLGVDVHWLPQSGRFLWVDAGKYYRSLTAIMPDIVVQRMSSCITGMIGKFCRRYGRSFVWICTDNASPDPWMHVSRQRQIYRHMEVTWPKRLLFSGNAIICDIMRQRGLRCVNQAFTQNDIQQEELRRSCGVNSQRIISGHPRPQNVLPACDKLANAMVLWAGNLGYNKRPELFLELARSCLATNLRFVMVGGGVSEQRVRGLFRDMPANLEWKHRLPLDETTSYFDRATFFTNTSVKEGFPNTFIQAWLRGVPTFSLGVDPDRVIIKNRLGYVATDLNDLRQRLLHLASSPQEYAELSNNAQRYAIANHTIAAMTEHFLRVLQSVGIMAHQGSQ